MTEEIISPEERDEPLPNVSEPTVTFKSLSDRSLMEVVSEKNGEPMMQISGYSLDVKFNMKYINSVADIDALCNGISSLFRELVTEQLIKHKQT